MGRLEGKVVLITGAARGQGAAEARQAAAEGAKVVVTDVLEEQGRDVATEVDGDFILLDVSSAGSWRSAVEETIDRHQRIDGLVNNAGIYRQEGLLEGTEDTFRLITEVNQIGVYLGMSAVAPHMVEGTGGSIVNISSVAGLRGYAAMAYVASKWAVRGMTKSAAVELAPHNVRVNSIHPGLIDTDMLQQVDPDIDRLLSVVPMGRLAEADEVANAVIFLLSDEASYVTGAELTVDGGMVAG